MTSEHFIGWDESRHAHRQTAGQVSKKHHSSFFYQLETSWQPSLASWKLKTVLAYV